MRSWDRHARDRVKLGGEGGSGWVGSGPVVHCVADDAWVHGSRFRSKLAAFGKRMPGPYTMTKALSLRRYGSEIAYRKRIRKLQLENAVVMNLGLMTAAGESSFVRCSLPDHHW